ncbi:hypothetical protein SAMN05192558_112174 [Actinokineospora alba]|uniref:Uncharacterized protein n=1 Tax=Actinokineospora alba TaxID=504798 RepID=A0A1H0UZX0_9PSEU|nr:hypothetical protein [Actinokineospora alba]TDP68958.1 hypothetical protein C8E96_4527 [Actinokineospora alba]SDI76164.1 hypothetical protein SAMN05421871_107230 [Actinokineospora alba]SDP71645.1 hypothetical protein SAMN05192558_112174 [Actinokineospora alba]
MNGKGGHLSDSEAELFAQLLERYCEFELDQFDHWIVDTAYGEVFVGLTRELPPNHPREFYAPFRRPKTEQ